MRDSQAAFIIYDLTNEESFNNIPKWVDFVKENRGDDVLIFAIGNKLDLEENRAISQDITNEKLKDIGKAFSLKREVKGVQEAKF